MTLLRVEVSLRRSIGYRVIDPSRRKASPIVRINPDACSAHTAYYRQLPGRGDGYSNEKWWGVGSKVQGYSGPGRVTQK